MRDMKVLIDTNVILDWIMSREPNATNAKRIMEQCLFGDIEAYITSHSVADLFYILRKDFTVDKRKALLCLLCESMEVIPEDKEIILEALRRRDWKDLEDGLQMQCAKKAGLDYIITQNLKDFQRSDVEAVNEEKFCEMIGWENDK